MKPGLIDRAVAIFSPRTAAERMRWRAAMSAMAHYDAAGQTRRTSGWKGPVGDGDVVARSARRIRPYARDMVRNNAIAKRAVSALVNTIVGDGIIPSVEADDDATEAQVLDAVRRHADTTAIDAAGRLNLYGMQRLIAETMFVTGEALVRYRPRLPIDALPMLFQLEILEPEYLDDRLSDTPAEGPSEIDGILFDALNRRSAYRLYRQHPNGVRLNLKSSVVGAENIAHVYRVDRPGQNRGTSWLASAMPLMQDAYDYADAQLLRQKIAAMWVAFTTDTNADGPDVADVASGSAAALPVPNLQPGMFEHLPPGRDVRFSSPPAAEGYAEHMKAVLRMVAAALDLTYEELSGDLEGVNFSSARIGRMAMQRAVSSAQWTVLMPSLCEPVGRWLAKGAEQATGIRQDRFRIKWTPPRFELTNPSDEIGAQLKAIGGGLTSRQRAIRDMGFDPDEIAREIAADKAEAERLGLAFEGSPAPGAQA